MLSLPCFVMILTLFGVPIVYADDKSITAEIYNNQTKIIIEKDYEFDTVKKSDISDIISDDLMIDEHDIGLINFQNMNMAEDPRLANKLRINVDVVNCLPKTHTLYELILPTTNQTEISDNLVGKKLLNSSDIEGALEINFDSVENASIRVKVEEDYSKSQIMLCNDRMSLKSNFTDQDQILTLIENSTGLTSAQITSVWDYHDTTIVESRSSDYVKPMSTDQIKEEAEKTMTQAEKQLGKAEKGLGSAISGGCLIATATFGSELSPQIQSLRETRDNVILQTESGKQFMDGFNTFYYSFSPAIADIERENPVFRNMVKVTLTPMLSTLSILNYLDIDSESEMLFYGISLIVLNSLMYFGTPIGLIYTVQKIRKGKSIKKFSPN